MSSAASRERALELAILHAELDLRELGSTPAPAPADTDHPRVVGDAEVLEGSAIFIGPDGPVTVRWRDTIGGAGVDDHVPSLDEVRARAEKSAAWAQWSRSAADRRHGTRVALALGAVAVAPFAAALARFTL